jgi:nitrate reductase alpha subunit
MGLGPENILAHPPNHSLINSQIWRGCLRISLMRGPQTRQDIYGRFEDGRQSGICYRQKRAHDQEKNPTSKHGVQCGAVCNWSNTIGEKQQKQNSDNN